VYSTQSHYDHIEVNNPCLLALIARLTRLSNSFINESRSTKFNVRSRLPFNFCFTADEEEEEEKKRQSIYVILGVFFLLVLMCMCAPPSHKRLNIVISLFFSILRREKKSKREWERLSLLFLSAVKQKLNENGRWTLSNVIRW